MKNTSIAVLALLFASTQAVKLSKSHDKNHQQFIGDEKIDEEVQGFASEHTTGLAQSHHHKKHHHHEGKGAVIGDKKINEEVQGFATDSTFELGQKKQHKKPDVAERNMDEEVHHFVADSTPPLNTRVRSNMPFVPNGSNPGAFQGSAFGQTKHHKKAKDISRNNLDPRVYDYVSDHLAPIHEIAHANEAPAMNGANSWQLSQHKKHHRKHHHTHDISTNNVDPDVYGYVNEHVPPIHELKPSNEAPAYNGANAGLSQNKKHKKPDVAERGMDGEVHDFVSHNIPPLNAKERSKVEFDPNGSDPSAHDSSLNQNKHKSHHKHHHQHGSKDIVEKNIDPYIYEEAWEHLPPLREITRQDKAPEHGHYVPGWGNYEFEKEPFKGRDELELHQKNPDIIGKPGWTNDEVEPFVSDNLPPLSGQWGSDRPWKPNGSDPSTQGTLAEADKGDIAERNMDSDYVQPFSAKQKPVEPIPDPSTRDFLPPAANGGSN